jgi:hypothetical protein
MPNILAKLGTSTTRNGTGCALRQTPTGDTIQDKLLFTLSTILHQQTHFNSNKRLFYLYGETAHLHTTTRVQLILRSKTCASKTATTTANATTSSPTTTVDARPPLPALTAHYACRQAARSATSPARSILAIRTCPEGARRAWLRLRRALRGLSSCAGEMECSCKPVWCMATCYE